MDMDNPINKLLEDLFAAAPELRERRAEVQATVEKMIAAQPTAALDEAFRAELRDRLLKEFAVQQIVAKKSLFPFGFALSRPALAFGGLVGLFIVITLAMRGGTPKPAANLAAQGQAQPAVTLALGGEIKHVGAGAFGALTAATADSGNTPSGAGASFAATHNNATADAVQVAAPSGAATRPMMAPTPVAVATGESTAAAKMVTPGMPIRYQTTRQEYRYAGELALPTAPVEVLKVDHAVDTAAVTARIADLKLGLLDLSRFEPAQTQYLNLVEDREFGYTVNVDFQNGTANIGQNWIKWPNSACSTTGRDCPVVAPLTAADLPSDTEAIAVAAVFVRDYGIDVTHYGEPVVDKSWQRTVVPMTASGAEAAAPAYVPDRVTVRYPLLVAGKAVYDQSGNPVGMNVSVDVRLRKVTDAGPIALQNYLASAYEPITDQAKVTKTIAAGGLGRWVDENAAKVVTHDLDAPQEVYVQVWNYADGVSAQYLVPALLFHVKDADAPMRDGEWFQSDVIVPLAKDFYAGVGPIMYMKGGGVSGSAGTSRGVIVPDIAPAPAADQPLR